MARIESVKYQPHRSQVKNGVVAWHSLGSDNRSANLPQIFWSDGSPWREANLWLMSVANAKDVSILTVQARATSIHAYAKWLEKENTHWREFPSRKENRCLVRYRGALLEARDNSEIAPSTATQRMRVVISFYRWLRQTGLISPESPLWNERVVGIRLYDAFGFERTFNVNSTDLSIPNRSAPGERLEDGLLPVSNEVRSKLLEFARDRASEELFLMLSIGFFTGMRLQTICDLKIQTLLNSVQDPATPELHRIAVGPGASPKVATKFGVSGQIWIPEKILSELLRYAHSIRRLKREAKAPKERKDLLFLTKFGNTYAQRGSDKSIALNVEMHNLRKRATAIGITSLRNFRFHQTRCTFATELARSCIKAGGAIYALAIVKEALLHRDEITSLKYIKFIEKYPIKEYVANEFTSLFFGLIRNPGGYPDDDSLAT